MDDMETLRYARNVLLSLHKALVDFERASYENIHGPLNAGQFLTMLVEDERFAWLRKFSKLIVEIDEMFSLKDGAPTSAVLSNLDKIRRLIAMSEEDVMFKQKYRSALQVDPDAAGSHAKLMALVSVDF